MTALPLEDTLEVKEAKADFMRVFQAAEAGEHALLAPVNNDVQAPQIATAYMADTEDVAAAKEAFHLEFKSVEAGGLANKQAAGPVAPPMTKVETPVVYSHLSYLVQPRTHLAYNLQLPLSLSYTGLDHLKYAAAYHYPVEYIALVKA